MRNRAPGMDVRVTNKKAQNTREITFTDGELASAECVWPDPNPRDFELVILQQDHGGLLTHPINGHITVAKLSKKLPPFVKSVQLDIRNASTQNQGVDFALILSNRVLTSDDFERISAGKALNNVVISKWHTLKAFGDTECAVAVNTDFHAHVYLASRLPEGIYEDSYCWAIWKGLTFFQ